MDSPNHWSRMDAGVLGRLINVFWVSVLCNIHVCKNQISDSTITPIRSLLDSFGQC